MTITVGTVLDEFSLCGALTEVEVEVEATRRDREWSEIDGHGRVCTFGGDLTVLSARLLRVIEVDGPREPRAEELAAFQDSFWTWLSIGNRERALQEEIFEGGVS